MYTHTLIHVKFIFEAAAAAAAATAEAAAAAKICRIGAYFRLIGFYLCKEPGNLMLAVGEGVALTKMVDDTV